MMVLTADQLADLQGDLGITNDQAVFTDAELNRLFARTDSDYNTTVYLAYRQLLGDAAKFFNYTVGQTRIEREAVFDHLLKMVEFWKAESRTNANQLAIVGLNEIPPRIKDNPESPVHRIRHWNWPP
jgi:hypothetical protein